MNEQRRILDLLSQGKVTVSEAEQLLAALPDTPEQKEVTEAKKPAKWLRVTVLKIRTDGANGTAKPEVNVRVPMALVRAGVKLGAVLPHVAGDAVNQQMRERGIDLTKISPEHLEEVVKELGDMTVDIDDGKHQVRVFCE